jgi:hypothetical protein
MGLFDSIGHAFGLDSSQKSFSATNNWSGPQQKTEAAVGNFVAPKIGQGATPYSGQRVAPMSSAEQGSQAWLQRYMDQTTPRQYGMANQQLQRVMGGNYGGSNIDPSMAQRLYSWAQGQATGALNDAQSGNIINDQATNDLYARIKDQMMRQLPELQNSVANNANLSGMYFSGGHEKMQGDLLKNTQSQLLDTLANLKYSDEQARRDLEANREARTYGTLSNLLNTGVGQQYSDIQARQGEGATREQRAYDAINQALNIGNAESAIPLQKAVAGQEYGALPRTLQQAGLDAKMEEFLRTLPENSPYLQIALNYLGQQGQQSTSGKASANNSGQMILNKLMPFTG